MQVGRGFTFEEIGLNEWSKTVSSSEHNTVLSFLTGAGGKGILKLLDRQEQELIVRIGMLRQWLNEDRKCEPMITNEDIKYWLKLHDTK